MPTRRILAALTAGIAAVAGGVVTPAADGRLSYGKERLKRGSKMLGAVGAVTVALVGLTPGDAFALSGYGYDGRWADQTPCGSDARTVRSASVTTSTQLGEVYGKVELRYSPTCRTVWARVTTPVLPIFQDATVFRNSDYHTMTCNGRLWSDSLHSYYCFTAMLYDGDVTSFAQADIGRSTYEEPAYGETGDY
ncbi:DUF2690 domain-containing protein [Micromonospora chersina]|uniref:DUF2690 domain-containing protein n=1 Tax=Micromonospora chersina TaxID=47854 RepID=UPI0033EE51F4